MCKLFLQEYTQRSSIPFSRYQALKHRAQSDWILEHSRIGFSRWLSYTYISLRIDHGKEVDEMQQNLSLRKKERSMKTFARFTRYVESWLLWTINLLTTPCFRHIFLLQLRAHTYIRRLTVLLYRELICWHFIDNSILLLLYWPFGVLSLSMWK